MTNCSTYEMGNGLKQIIITLSADNGVGLPATLAVACDDDFEHGP